MPRASVITPTYNRAQLLRRAIESVQSQTINDYEHIIVDDCSSDDTQEVVESYDDPRIRYHRLAKNYGGGYARNQGIKMANSEYISFLDDDDEYLPKKLDITTSKLDALPNTCAGVFHRFKIVEDGKEKDISASPLGTIHLQDVVDANRIGTTSCTTFRKKALEAIGGFDDQFISNQDYDLYLRILKSYTMVGIKDCLVNHHDHGLRMSYNLEKTIKGQRQLIEKHPNLFDEHKISRQAYYRARLYALEGEIKESRKEFRRAISLYPRDPLYYYHYASTIGGKKGFEWGDWLKRNVKLKVLSWV